MRTATLMVIVVALSAASPVAATAVVCRNPVDARAWAVMPDASESLTWMWEDGATTATLTASNVATKASASTVVARGSAADGSAAIPLATSGRQLVDVTLVQGDGETTISSTTVRLAVGSDATVYTDATAREFTNLDEARIYSWSDLWDDASAGASAATLTASVTGGSDISSQALPAVGGFGILSARTPFGRAADEVTASVAFDGVTYLTANLRLGGAKLLIFFK